MGSFPRYLLIVPARCRLGLLLRPSRAVEFPDIIEQMLWVAMCGIVAMQKSAVHHHAPGSANHPRDDSAAQSSNAEYDRAYGDTGSPKSQSQTRKSQLGASYSACSHTCH